MTSTLVASKKNWRKKTTVTEFFFYWVFPTETAIITALIRFDILMGSMLYSNGFVSMASKFGDAARNRKLQRKKKKKNGENQIFLGQISMSGKYASGVLFFPFTRVTGFFLPGFTACYWTRWDLMGLLFSFIFFYDAARCRCGSRATSWKGKKKRKRNQKIKIKKRNTVGFLFFPDFHPAANDATSSWKCDIPDAGTRRVCVVGRSLDGAE